MDKFSVKKYLEENPEVAVDVAREVNGWDGRFSFVDTWDLSELVQCYCGDYESTQKFLDIMLNSLDTLPRDIYTPVRFSEYGDYLEAADDDTVQEEVFDALDEIVDAIESLYPNSIEIYDIELKKLVESEFDVKEVADQVWEETEKHYKGSEINADTLMSTARRFFDFSDDDLLKLEEFFIEEENGNVC